MKQAGWTSSLGFVMALAGSAVGLGNFWRFPYICGKYGGAAFILVYLAAISLVGFPLLVAETAMGRAAATNPVHTLEKLSRGRLALAKVLACVLAAAAIAALFYGKYFHALAAAMASLGVFRFGYVAIGFLATCVTQTAILSFYSVLGGWVMLYAGLSLTGRLETASLNRASSILRSIVGCQGSMGALALAGSIAFLGVTVLIVSFGVQKGIERCSKFCMPIILGLLLVIIVRGLCMPGAMKGVEFMLKPDFSALSREGIMAALGQAAFTLSVGTSVGLCYGSYLDKKSTLMYNALCVLIVDTLLALLAGLAIFPILFSVGAQPTEGLSLVFKILPIALGKLLFPGLWGFLFFGVLLLAALTSSVSMLEGLVCYLSERFKFSRPKVCLAIFLPLLGLTSVTALSSQDFRHLPALGRLLNGILNAGCESVFALFDTMACSYFMPLTGLVFLLFAGFVWGKKDAALEVMGQNPKPKLVRQTKVWFFLAAYVAPLFIVLLFLKGIGFIR